MKTCYGEKKQRVLTLYNLIYIGQIYSHKSLGVGDMLVFPLIPIETPCSLLSMLEATVCSEHFLCPTTISEARQHGDGGCFGELPDMSLSISLLLPFISASSKQAPPGDRKMGSRAAAICILTCEGNGYSPERSDKEHISILDS